jgi:hypothetical protein
MNLSSKDVIAGHPAWTIRNLLRHLGSTFNGAGVEFVVQRLKLKENDATALLNELTNDGYLEVCHMDDTKLWRNTIKGNAVSMAKFIKPITREKAESILKSFLERVAALNADPYYLIGIRKVEVFGSYQSEAKSVNDIDLVVYYEWKGNPSEEERSRLTQMRSQEAQRKGRRFPNMVERLFWPQSEVKLYITAKEPRLSLHTPDDDIVNVVQKKVLYQGPLELFSAGTS